MASVCVVVDSFARYCSFDMVVVINRLRKNAYDVCDEKVSVSRFLLRRRHALIHA
jgi:hypothetical protein